MPIVVSRKTGEILSKPEYTQDQIDRAWAVIIQAYIRAHPEILFPESLQQDSISTENTDDTNPCT